MTSLFFVSSDSFFLQVHLQKTQRSVTLCTMSFLPVVLELSPGAFNNSVLAASGDQAGRARQRVSTNSTSQSGGGGGPLLRISERRRSHFVLLSSTTVS